MDVKILIWIKQFSGFLNHKKNLFNIHSVLKKMANLLSVISDKFYANLNKNVYIQIWFPKGATAS